MTDSNLPVPYEPPGEPYRVTTGPLEATRGPEPRRHGPGDISYPRPDFVLFGIADTTGGVLLFASDQMSQAELQSRVEKIDLIPVAQVLARVPDRRTTLRVELRSFTMIRAETYIDALRSLMETWRPPEPQR
jgi:hypothetical protein